MQNQFHEGELVFDFRGAQYVEKRDKPGVPQPTGMKLVDFVVEEGDRTLLIEVKDPSDRKASEKERKKFPKRLVGDKLINDHLVPKVRDSYTYLHLMKRDDKEITYVVVCGLDAYPDEAALLLGFKDRLLRKIRRECREPWKLKYIKDCIVVTIDGWRKYFDKYSLNRNAGSERLHERKEGNE